VGKTTTMEEPTVSEIQTALDVLKYYESEAENKDERMLRALMSDTQSNIRSHAPIILDDSEKWETVRDMQ